MRTLVPPYLAPKQLETTARHCFSDQPGAAKVAYLANPLIKDSSRLSHCPASIDVMLGWSRSRRTKSFSGSKESGKPRHAHAFPILWAVSRKWSSASGIDRASFQSSENADIRRSFSFSMPHPSCSPSIGSHPRSGEGNRFSPGRARGWQTLKSQHPCCFLVAHFPGFHQV